MSKIPEITLVIPTYNMAEHLPTLVSSLAGLELIEQVPEILFVDDGSTDSTPEVLDLLKKRYTHLKLAMHRLTSNQGRFIARYEGAKNAKTPSILLLDTRIELKPDFLKTLSHLAQTHPSLVGSTLLDIRRSPYALYWDRIHRFIFRKHYRDLVHSITLTPQNFDQYLKGTTLFFCPREHFIQCCEPYLKVPLLSDDTFLMRRMVENVPIVVHPQLEFFWYPRETYGPYVKRLFERGPFFVEYHVFHRKGVFFALTMLWVLFVFLWFWSLFALPLVALAILFLGLLSLALSALPLSHNLMEWSKLAPIHISSFLAYGFGVLWGIPLNAYRLLRRTRLQNE